MVHTTYGDLEVELWCKEAPRAARNFIQLALEGYYDQTVFHRLLPGFIVQAGDPTGTGTGGQSIYGAPFKVETHSRLSFARRGLLGMAATDSTSENGNGSKNENAIRITSQFFFTLGPATELDRTNTVLGRVVGDTLYNLLRIGEVQVDPATDRPLYPPTITSIDVLLNPFDDIVPRELPEVRERLQKVREATKPSAAPKITATAIKNKTLLSFDDDEEGEEDAMMTMLSSHDILNDPTLSRKQLDTSHVSVVRKTITKRHAEEPSAYEQIKAEQKADLHKIQQQVASVQQDIKNMDQIQPSNTGEEVEETTAKDSVQKLLGRKPLQAEPKKSKSLLQQQQDLYKSKKNVIVGRRAKNAVEDVNTLLTLNAFKEKLQSLDHDTNHTDPTKLAQAADPEPAKLLQICKLHGLVNCLSCRDTFGIAKDEAGNAEAEGWLMHRLVFDKEVGYRELREELTNLVVIDPKEKAKEILAKKK